ncbi:hypothetical protein Axi01nite_17190 [Actinoplanes xinjiangensis]|nr:hypothetical protein Axi01nite_17190 [Actinoplanes xinjiangensis]
MTDQTVFQAQKITPNATAMTEAMTMSIVRQRRELMSFIGMPPSGYREETHAVFPGRRCPGHDAAGETELPALALPRSGTRVCGFTPHSQRCALPCRIEAFP